MTRRGDIRIGVSGWTYKPWHGAFFPKGLPRRRDLAYLAEAFPAVEVNGTFYSLQRPSSFERWATETPEDFVFAVKAPRFITHVKRLRDVAAPLANFFASGVLRLEAKLGPVLWQLPPSVRFEKEELDAFLAMLPRGTGAAAALARHHDDRVAGRTSFRVDAERPVRHALEIRNESFRDAGFIEMLRRHEVALVCADTVKWPRLMDVTADFVYCRLHGSTELYRSDYDDAALDRWAARLLAWSTGRLVGDGSFAGERSEPHRPRDVFLFFDNTDKLRAPDNARSLMAKLGLDRHGFAAPPARPSAARRRETGSGRPSPRAARGG